MQQMAQQTQAAAVAALEIILTLAMLFQVLVVLVL
jgi:hypothetical protein